MKVIIFVLAFLVSNVCATNLPNISQIQKGITVPKIEDESKSVPAIGYTQQEMIPNTSNEKIYISTISVDGIKSISKDFISSITQQYENQELTFAQLQELTTKITKIYRERGYFVARAYIPKQDISKHTCKIIVIEGGYADIKLQNSSLVNDNKIMDILNTIDTNNSISSVELEKSILIINDMAGVIVTKADVRPGKNIGSSDVIISTKSTKSYSGYIILDNYGSKYTGKNRLSAGVDINSPFGIGDKLSFSTLLTKNKELANGRIGYMLPISTNGTKLEISASKTSYELGSNYASLDAVGSSQSIDTTMTYPIIKTINTQLNIYSTIVIKNLKDEVKSTQTLTDKNLKAITIGANLEQKQSFGSFTLDTYISSGRLRFDNQDAKDTDLISANTQGNYTKANIDIAQSINLGTSFVSVSTIKLQKSLNNKNLDGSEDITISGNNGVRVFPDSELSAEDGYLFSTELFYILSKNYGKVSLFYDIGSADMADNSGIDFARHTLQDVGMSYYGTYDTDMSYKIQYARQIGATNSTTEDQSKQRVLLQGMYTF